LGPVSFGATFLGPRKMTGLSGAHHDGYERTHLICSTVMSARMSTIGTVMVRRASAALSSLPASFDACRLSDNVCTREAVHWQIRHHPMGLTAVNYEPAIAGCATIPVGQP
jgi:hypothetical protein